MRYFIDKLDADTYAREHGLAYKWSPLFHEATGKDMGRFAVGTRAELDSVGGYNSDIVSYERGGL